METSLELFVKKTKYPVSQNVTEVIKKAQEVRESLVDTFKKLCIDDVISPKEMNIVFRREHPRYYYPSTNSGDNESFSSGEYYPIPDKQRVELKTICIGINNKIDLNLKENIQDYGHKVDKVVINISNANLSFWMKLRKLFGAKFTYTIEEHSFNITKGSECFIESFDIRQNISLEEYNLLSSFFEEQKGRKKLEEKVKLYNGMIKNIDSDTKFVSEELQ